MTHEISTDRAYNIDLEWSNVSSACNDGEDENMLRIVSYRTPGNGTRSVLCLPGNDSSPRYQYRSHSPETGEYHPAYYHVSGPTLDEWLMQAEYRDAAETTAGLLSF